MWNHRVIVRLEDDEPFYGIHEVHYDEFGEPEYWTMNPVAVTSCSIDEMTQTLKRMNRATKLPILIEDDGNLQPYAI